MTLGENGVYAGQALFCLQANLRWLLRLALRRRLQFAVVFSHKVRADLVVQNGLHTALSIRPTQQQPAASKHCRGDNVGVPRDGDEVVAAQTREVGAHALVHLV